jgi:uncharacterized protein (DUF1015 family)
VANVQPFRAIRYQSDTAGPFDDLITPPFDVISPEQREALFAQSPHNYARIILPEALEAGDKYETAAGLLGDWLATGAMAQDDEPHFYLLSQRFTGLDGQRHERRGFFGVAKIPEDGEETVLGHERTFPYKIQDRLALTRATAVNTGSVFVLYDDADAELADFLAQMDEREPDIAATTIDGVEQRVWAVPALATVTDAFRGKTLYIADGHHRYATAKAYRDEQRELHPSDELQPHDFVLFGFVALQDPGLIVYPAHRVLDAPDGLDAAALLTRLEEWFEVSEPKADLLPAVQQQDRCAFGVCIAGHGERLLVLKDGVDRAAWLGEDHGPAWRELDVAVLHRGIIEGALGLPEGTEFSYIVDGDEALDAVRSGGKGLAFLMRNLHAKQICDCADAREFMPQKATYFFPKLPSGAVINPLK